MADMTVMTFAVAIFLGSALSQFFGAISRDLVAPIIGGVFPGAQAGLEKWSLQLGPVKLGLGDALSATVNLTIAILVVYLTLPYIRTYSPIQGGRR
jgi:large-conductance mechanosensitive channel